MLHYGKPGTGLELVTGMTFTIEPMINAGRRDVRLLPDGWTVVTKDQSLSAQWEHTILVTDQGYEVLTLGAAAALPAAAAAALLNAHGKFLDPTADWPYSTAVPEALHDGPILARRIPPGARCRAANCCSERFAADEAIEDLVRDRARLVDIALRAAWVRARRQICGRSGAGGGRRLRARRAASELGHRHHGAAAEERFGRLAARHREIPDVSLGHRPRGRAQRALHRRLPAREPRRHQRRHHPVRGAPAGGSRVAVRRHAPRARARSALVLAGFLRGQGQGADRAPPPLFRHRLQPRTERQIEPGGLARHSDHRLGGEAAFRHRHAR